MTESLCSQFLLLVSSIPFLAQKLCCANNSAFQAEAQKYVPMSAAVLCPVRQDTHTLVAVSNSEFLGREIPSLPIAMLLRHGLQCCACVQEK